MKQPNIKFHLLAVLTVLSLILAAFTPAAVSATADPSSQTIVQIAASNPKFSTLVAAVQAAGLVDTLNSPGPFTVFAPTNRAFDKLGQATIDALLKDPAMLSSILLYHVSSGKLMAADVVQRNSITMADGIPTLVRVDDHKVYINKARIITTDIQASNGVIHVIDAVLLPPTKNIVETAAADPRFSTLVAAVGAAGLVDALKAAGPFTVFAPTNDAFAKLGQSTIDALLKDPAMLKNILLYHVLGSEVVSADAAKLSHATTLNGQDVVITSRSGWNYRDRSDDRDGMKYRNGQLYINNARVVVRDILTTNGVIHAIDTVLLPPTKNIVDTAAADPQFSTLVAAVGAAGLVDALKGPGPFTVFAPTNAAFAKLGQATIDALLKDPAALSNILLYHVLDGKVYSADAAKAGHATTKNGQDVVINSRSGWNYRDGSDDRNGMKYRNGQLYINDARVVVRDILTTNGVIHVIDTVLIPPSKDIVDTLAARPEFSTLVAAVQAAGLVDTLKSAGPFTIFAPTNKAFEKLPKGTVEALLKDPAMLKSILLYHAVSGRVYSADARMLTSATTINGATVKIRVDDGNLFINQAKVKQADILTTNGVIHVINGVLIPPK